MASATQVAAQVVSGELPPRAVATFMPLKGVPPLGQYQIPTITKHNLDLVPGRPLCVGAVQHPGDRRAKPEKLERFGARRGPGQGNLSGGTHAYSKL